jgi:sarcosine oxidase
VNDVIVIGTGAMGSATCYALAKRGVNVLGLEQFSIGHTRGSSHGHSRLIRKAYFEHPDYVPLCERSYVLWDALCAETGRALFHRTGLVMFGPSFEHGVLKGVRESARLHGVPVDSFDADAVAARFPQFIVPAGYCGVLEPDAGYLEVEACVTAMCERATAHGATIRVDEHVVEWRATETGVEVTTDRGRYSADKLVITAMLCVRPSRWIRLRCSGKRTCWPQDQQACPW